MNRGTIGCNLIKAEFPRDLDPLIKMDLIKIKVSLHTVREFVLPLYMWVEKRGRGGSGGTSYVNGIQPVDMLKLLETLREHGPVVGITDS